MIDVLALYISVVMKYIFPSFCILLFKILLVVESGVALLYVSLMIGDMSVKQELKT